MKKALIITIHYVDNFGSVLQTYATQHVFDRLGCRAQILDYVRENYRYPYLLKETNQKYKERKGILYSQPFRSLLLFRWSLIYKQRERIFSKFRKNHFQLTKSYKEYGELMQEPPVADIYVTGSDQVWNNEYNGGFLPEYFLSFAPQESKKIAFSASFGKTQFSRAELLEMQSYLQKYDGISVRESSGVEVIHQMNCQPAMHVLDPTLMLSKEEWCEALNISSSCKKARKGYVLLYQLNFNDKMKIFAERLAKENNLNWYIVSAAYKIAPSKAKILNNLAPEEFVSLINGADYVVTDSFHGTAFSLNFHKNVYVFNPPKYSTRLSSILTLVDSESRLVEDEMDWSRYPAINFETVDAIFQTEREKGKEFIRGFLDVE